MEDLAPRASGLAALAQAEDDGLIRLRVAEIRHLVWGVVWEVKPLIAAVLDWSLWRRRHQARARACHDKRRLHALRQQLQL